MNKKKVLVYLISFMSLVGLIIGNEKNEKIVKAKNLYDENEMLTPIWETDTVYNESVLVVKEKDGSIEPINLLYDIEKIISVKSASLKIEYKEHDDYEVIDNKLVINPSGSIYKMSYDEFHPKNGNEGFEDINGGYICFNEGSYFHDKQIVVTYTHNDNYKYYIPESKGNLLPKTIDKLNNRKKDEFSILVYGDSISTGANSSGHPMINVAPYMPIYPKQVALGLKKIYGMENVTLYNAAVGGTDSTWGLSNIRTNIFNKYDVDFDLIIVAFGMNDISYSATTSASNIKKIATSLLAKYKNSEVLMIGTMIPNPDAYKFVGQQHEIINELKQYEKEGLVAVNITRIHQDLLKEKRYADLTGNNVNHANDFLARIYAHAILKTFEVEIIDEPSDNNSTSEKEDSSSGEQTSNSEQTSNGKPNNSSEIIPNKKGCNGSIAFKNLMFGLFASIIVFLRKRRK